MRACEQMPGMSVLEHGKEVNRYFHDLRAHVLSGEPLHYNWRLPDWIFAECLWAKIDSVETLDRYQIYHDCGKPFCIEVDEEGRRHFPDHANVSADIWLALTGEQNVSDLMRMDMDIHLLKDVGVEAFAAKPQAASLLITGLCELHANAAMFGGIESVSSKMKWKAINKRGKKIVSILAQE